MKHVTHAHVSKRSEHFALLAQFVSPVQSCISALMMKNCNCEVSVSQLPYTVDSLKSLCYLLRSAFEAHEALQL